MELRESDLPGIGKKFSFELANDSNVIVIMHKGGRREIYIESPDDDPQLVLTMKDEEARLLGAVLGGAYYQPVTQEVVSLAVRDLVVDWIPITTKCLVMGRSIGELEIRQKTGATIVAILNRDTTNASPGPADVLHSGDTVVATGLAHQIAELRRLLGTEH